MEREILDRLVTLVDGKLKVVTKVKELGTLDKFDEMSKSKLASLGHVKFRMAQIKSALGAIVPIELGMKDEEVEKLKIALEWIEQDKTVKASTEELKKLEMDVALLERDIKQMNDLKEEVEKLTSKGKPKPE